MTRMMVLGGLLATLCLVLVWELAAPADNPAAPGAVPVSPTPAADAGNGKTSAAEPGAATLAGVAASITERPLFSPTRRPATVTASVAGGPAASDTVPRLTGVIVGPSGGWAIFAGADGKSHAAGAGDVIGAFKVRTIDPGAVTLTGSEGDRVLHPTYANPPGGASAAAPASVAVQPSLFRAPEARDAHR